MKRFLICVLCVLCMILLALPCLYGCNNSSDSGDNAKGTETETKIETEAETETETATETKTETATETEAATETETEIATEAEAETETATETKAETAAETEAATETETETATETETETETATETETIAETETATETEPEMETETEPETETETATETDTEIETETEMETETESETETAAETETAMETESETTPIAGTDSGIVRDGTPKKYFTLAFDDGITQDQQIVELLRKYEVDCCTFYINTGLLGTEWTWVGPYIGHPEVIHLRYTEEELQSGIYDGFDIEVHTLTHPSLSTLTKRQVQREVGQDAKNITKIFGVQPVGMAWPGGDGQYTAENILNILEKTNIRFARGTTATNSFALPHYFMTWYPTTSITSGNVLTLAQRFLAADCTEDMLFYVWGHGYELDAYNKWDTLESLISMMSEASRNGDVVLVTQAEFYQLFKDEIPSWGDEASVK